jgi:hypothetical protein
MTEMGAQGCPYLPARRSPFLTGIWLKLCLIFLMPDRPSGPRFSSQSAGSISLDLLHASMGSGLESVACDRFLKMEASQRCSEEGSGSL